MNAFAYGLLAGWVSSLIVSACVAWLVYRRYERLQQRARQAERLAELGTLTGGLAHEIKNPLSTIQLNLQLLAEDIPPDTPASTRLISRLNTVQKEAGRLRDILDDFLRFAGRIELVRKPIEINAMLEELADFFSPQALLQRVQVRLRPSDGPMTAAIDERLLKQAVLNLMINALQAIGDQPGEILLGARKDNGRVLIDVTDTGRGMNEEQIRRIFDAYYSTKRGGIGLGLAISRRIVDEHGGTINVSSEIGKGSSFTIELPP